MTKGRHHKATNINGRRCNRCRKLAKDIVNNEYLCRLHSPKRQGYKNETNKNKNKKESKSKN